MIKDTVRQVVVVLSTVVTLTVNALANALPLNGQTTGEVSDRFKVYFVPAGYVFSIWSLIYALLIALTVYQALPAQRENPALRRVGYLYALSCLANSAWIFLWHYELFPLTLLAMLALLGLLIAIYLNLGIGRTPASSGERWLVRLPFSVYLGWITVATIANVSSLLYFLEWDGWGISPEAWTVIMLVAATAITAATLFTRRDVAYGLVIVWALAGIGVKHAGTPVVSPAAWAATAAVVVMLLALVLLIDLRSRRPAI
jgi:hypothetical protein